ncbi:MAG: hypothetical protein JKP95_01775 [Oceanicaulis sp.]|nr:hypothetical protein [Oceanicaulis sp.]
MRWVTRFTPLTLRGALSVRCACCWTRNRL